ncbi:MAG: hypothetical protein ACREN5_17520 [Gemmatimonadales bacterium]
MDLVLGPHSSPITDAVADVTEKHKMPMVAPAAANLDLQEGAQVHLHGAPLARSSWKGSSTTEGGMKGLLTAHAVIESIARCPPPETGRGRHALGAQGRRQLPEDPAAPGARPALGPGARRCWRPGWRRASTWR